MGIAHIHFACRGLVYTHREVFNKHSHRFFEGDAGVAPWLLASELMLLMMLLLLMMLMLLMLLMLMLMLLLLMMMMMLMMMMLLLLLMMMMICQPYNHEHL